MQLVIAAGGKGTRLLDGGISTPKSLVLVGGKAILERQLKEAEREGFTNVLLLLGHGSEEVLKFVNESRLEISVETFVEDNPLGPFGALQRIKSKLDDKFAFVMGDLFIHRSNLGGLMNRFLRSSWDLEILVKKTDHPEDSDLIELGFGTEVLNIGRYSDFREKSRQINIGCSGIFFAKRDAILHAKLGNKSFSEVVTQLIQLGNKISSVFHQGIVKDVGTPERLHEANTLRLSPMELESIKSCAILDRDGTLFDSPDYATKIEEFCPTDVAESLIYYASNIHNYLALATNQPVVARGGASLKQISMLNRELIARHFELEFDQIRFCPHHPDSGFPGERKELKFACICRKPNPGMILDIADSLNIPATSCEVIGDAITDLVAAERSGANWIHVNRNCSGFHGQLVQGRCLADEKFSLELFSHLKRNKSLKVKNE